jgi:hypothetical protein
VGMGEVQCERWRREIEWRGLQERTAETYVPLALPIPPSYLPSFLCLPPLPSSSAIPHPTFVATCPCVSHRVYTLSLNLRYVKGPTCSWKQEAGRGRWQERSLLEGEEVGRGEEGRGGDVMRGAGKAGGGGGEEERGGERRSDTPFPPVKHPGS